VKSAVGRYNPPLSRDAAAERMKLYLAGESDTAIAAKQGVRRRSIYGWRLRNSLPLNSPFSRNAKLSAEQSITRMTLYMLGWTDVRIARDQCVHPNGIWRWRKSRGLPSNALGVSPPPFLMSMAQCDYTDQIWGCCRPASRSHRRVPLKRDPAIWDRAIQDYCAGSSIAGVARALNLNRNTFRRELRSKGLARPYSPSAAHADKWTLDLAVGIYLKSGLLASTARACGLSDWVLRAQLIRLGLLRPYIVPKNETLRDPMFTALLGQMGDLAIANMVGACKTTVWKYRHSLGIKAYRPTRTGQPPICILSIDNPRPLGGSYHEIHKDDRWSNWLEEMGATVW
jgi:hypothetical protein